VRQAQAANLRDAREQGALLSRILPAWIEERGGKLHLITERAAALRKVFELAAGGLGIKLIHRRLVGENVPAFGRSGRWTHSYLALLLRDRRVIGEHQPRHKDGTLDGEAMPGYFPAAVPEALFYAARAGAAERHDKPGRRATTINLFAHLLRDARSGAGYLVRNRREPVYDKAAKKHVCSPLGHRHAVLEAAKAKEGAAASSFPYPTFEKAVLGMLREVDPKEIIGTDNTPAVIDVLKGQLTQLRAEKAQVKADMLKRYSSTLVEVAAQLDEREAALDTQLLEARQRLATPLGQAWSDAMTLTEFLDKAPNPEETRLRLRSALRRMVDSIPMIVTARGTNRLAAVQVWFAGGKQFRDYQILHRPAKGNNHTRTPGQWWCESIRYPAGPKVIDLRTPEGAKYAAEQLLAFDPSRDGEGKYIITGPV
jgi:hypothetical protein